MQTHAHVNLQLHLNELRQNETSLAWHNVTCGQLPAQPEAQLLQILRIEAERGLA